MGSVDVGRHHGMVLRQKTEKRDLDIGHAKEKFYYVLFGVNQFLPRVIKLGVLVWNMT